MANNVTSNPLVIDTATDAEIMSDTFHALSIRWVSSSATTGDAADVQDKDGNTKWESVTNDARHVEAEHFPHARPLRFNGLKVPTLGSGTVYIYMFEDPPKS